VRNFDVDYAGAWGRPVPHRSGHNKQAKQRSMAHSLGAIVSGWSPNPADQHPRGRPGSPCDVLQFRGKELSIRESILVQDANEILAGFPLFLGVRSVDPRLEQGHEFCAAVTARQVLLQETQGVRVNLQALPLGSRGQPLLTP
jgi:hypothetical protein